MNTFFKELADTMSDRQEMRVNIKKIGEDLVVLVVPDFKNQGKNINMSGTPEEMDINFINELVNFKDAKVEFTAEVTTSTNDEEEEEVKGNIPAGSEKGREIAKAKKEATKKAVKKVEPVKENPDHNEGPDPTEEVKEEAKVEEPVIEAKEEEVADVDFETQEETFEIKMAEGKALFDERKYADAKGKYQEALDLQPDNEKAKAAFANAEKWQKAVERLNPVTE